MASKYTASQVILGALTWGKYIAEKGTYKYQYYATEYGHECPVCHPHGGANYGWQCIGFVTACFHHGGGWRGHLECNCIGLGDDSFFDKNPTTEQWNAHNGPGWKRITSKRIAATTANIKKYGQPGDVLSLYVNYSGKSYHHTALYYGYLASKKTHYVLENVKLQKWRFGSGNYKYMHIYRYVGPGASSNVKPYTNKNIKVGTLSSATLANIDSGHTRKTISTKTKGKPGLVKVRKSKSAADVRAGAVALALDIAADNRFHYGLKPNSQHNGCYFCGTQGRNKSGVKMRQYSYCCNPFVGACYAHGGGEPLALKLCKHGSSWDFKEGTGYDRLAREGRKFKKISNPSLSKLLPGDVGCSGIHVKMYVGKWDGKHHICHSSGGDDNVPGSSKWNHSIRVETISSTSGYRWYRYIGNGGKMMHRLSSNGTGTIPGVDGSTTGGGRISDDGSGIILENEIKELYSSDNYSFVNLDLEGESESSTRFRSDIQAALNANFVSARRDSGAVGETILTGAIENLKFDAVSTSFQSNKAARMKSEIAESLTSYPNLVEAPTIVLDFNGIKIGGIGNSGDIFPNYLDSMSINKINGRINRYSINLVYQVRPGEDPNFIDKLLSRVGYTRPLKILYGDSVYPDNYFREEEVFIMDAKHNEDPASAKITYSLTAISSVGASIKSSTNFNSVIDKPSNQIYNLLYNSGEISTSLMNAFPGMQNRQIVASSGFIPSNDSVVKIPGMSNSSPTAYLSTLVSSMVNASGETSSYFLTYNDDSKFNGSYFKISEVKKLPSSSLYNLTGSVYSVDVGYPSNNMVMNFQLCDNNYWSLAYKFAGSINTYEYDIDNSGNIVSNKINLINRNSKFEQYSLIDENWWKQITEFPISAKLTLKGLVTPAMLMSYINVNALFYGQRDIASGLYVVTEENDTISGSGYRTELTLLRVAED